MRSKFMTVALAAMLAGMSLGAGKCARDQESAPPPPTTSDDEGGRRGGTLGAGGSAFTPTENSLYLNSLRAQAITVATVNGALVNKRDFRKALAVCDVGTLGGTTPTLDVKLQDAPSADTTVTDGATTASSTTVTSATAAFVATDVGLRITVADAGPGTPPKILDTTIVSITNGTTVVVAKAASQTTSGKNLTVYTRPGTPADVSGAAFTQFTTARSGLSAVANVDVDTKRDWLRLVATGAGTTPTGAFSCGFVFLYPRTTPISPGPSPAPDFSK